MVGLLLGVLDAWDRREKVVRIMQRTRMGQIFHAAK